MERYLRNIPKKEMHNSRISPEFKVLKCVGILAGHCAAGFALSFELELSDLEVYKAEKFLGRKSLAKKIAKMVLANRKDHKMPRSS